MKVQEAEINGMVSGGEAVEPDSPEGLDILKIESEDMPDEMLYKVTDKPPIYMTIFFAFQQSLVVLTGSLAVSSFVADVACASDFPDIKTNLLSSTLFMNGVTTLMMVTLGIRLPLFQGAASDYVVPLLAIQLIDKDFCKLPESEKTPVINMSLPMETNISVDFNDTMINDYSVRKAFAYTKLQEFQGCLIVVGIIHCLVGLTGTVGYILKFIGPVTVVPAILLSGIFLSRATAKFGQSHWGITALTAATSMLLSLYLGHKKMPCPAWSKKRGFYIYWYPFHQVFSILIGILVGWSVSAIMTYAGALTDDPKQSQYFARSDARSGAIANASWFRVPYPNQFGPPSFSVGIFLAFLIATLTSILDSIGDYYACARICNVPPPPKHGVNRGIAVEGFCSMISGVVGCGHATTTNGGSIGAVGVTKVASLHVFVGVSVIYILFGVVGKVSAVFITIPQPVLGGAMIVMFGMFNGVVLSNLQALSLSSTRNLAIIGTSLLIGLMVPYWLEKYPNDVDTGDAYYNNIIKTILANPNLCGGLLACFLDNTVPGTKEERGITAWQHPEKAARRQHYSEGLEVYYPVLPTKWRSFTLLKYLPICVYQPPISDESTEHTE